jgi:hypothetical protein
MAPMAPTTTENHRKKGIQMKKMKYSEDHSLHSGLAQLIKLEELPHIPVPCRRDKSPLVILLKKYKGDITVLRNKTI